MPLQPDATRDKCIDASVRIVCSAIESGKLSSDVEEVIKYFSDVYGRLYRVVSKPPSL